MMNFFHRHIIKEIYMNVIVLLGAARILIGAISLIIEAFKPVYCGE